MKTMKTPTLRPLIQAAAIAACLASASPALAQQAERHYFNGTDFKGGQVVIPKSAIDNPDTKRWVASRKAAVVRAVLGGLISEEEALQTYGLTAEEFLAWRMAVDKYGEAALKTTRLQKYRQL